MNRFERFVTNRTEARVRYLAGEIQVLLPGEYVCCAVTGEHIELKNLKYWSVELQEAYVSAEVSWKRFLETKKNTRNTL